MRLCVWIACVRASQRVGAGRVPESARRVARAGSQAPSQRQPHASCCPMHAFAAMHALASTHSVLKRPTRAYTTHARRNARSLAGTPAHDTSARTRSLRAHRRTPSLAHTPHAHRHTRSIGGTRAHDTNARTHAHSALTGTRLRSHARTTLTGTLARSQAHKLHKHTHILSRSLMLTWVSARAWRANARGRKPVSATFWRVRRAIPAVRPRTPAHRALASRRSNPRRSGGSPSRAVVFAALARARTRPLVCLP